MTEAEIITITNRSTWGSIVRVPYLGSSLLDYEAPVFGVGANGEVNSCQQFVAAVAFGLWKSHEGVDDACLDQLCDPLWDEGLLVLCQFKRVELIEENKVVVDI